MANYETEIEYKFFPEDTEAVFQKLSNLATLKQSRTLMRMVSCRREDNPQFKSMDVVRIRDEWDKIMLRMKQRYLEDVTLEHALEKEFQVESFDLAVDMLDHMWLTVSMQSEKYRSTWELDECEIMYDENPWLEGYFEIEWPSEEKLKSVCEILWCNWETKRNDSARMLYQEKYGKDARDIHRITFAENPFIS